MLFVEGCLQKVYLCRVSECFLVWNLSLSGDELNYIFAALSHETRRFMVKALGESEALSFTELMNRTGIEETGTFGFHLKRVEELVQRLPDGRYKLSPLGESSYRIILYSEKPEAYAEKKRVEAKVMPPPFVVGPELEIQYLGNVEKILLNREKLGRYNKIVIINCDEVLIDSDVDLETAKAKILAFENIGRLLIPKHLYKFTLSRLELNCGDVNYYEGELPTEPPEQKVKVLGHCGETIIIRKETLTRLADDEKIAIENAPEVIIEDDVSPELAEAKIQRISLVGSIQASPKVKRVISDKITG